METIQLRTQQRTEFRDITGQVEQCLKRAGIQQGLCLVYCPHTTAGITVNEHADPDVARDMVLALNKLVPLDDPDYRHTEGNSAAHIKASLMGTSATLLVADGRLVLGTWQGIFFCEFDGPRDRKVHVRLYRQE